MIAWLSNTQFGVKPSEPPLCLQYLNTVIPYEKKGTPPSVDDLQMLTKSKNPAQNICI